MLDLDQRAHIGRSAQNFEFAGGQVKKRKGFRESECFQASALLQPEGAIVSVVIPEVSFGSFAGREID